MAKLPPQSNLAKLAKPYSGARTDDETKVQHWATVDAGRGRAEISDNGRAAESPFQTRENVRIVHASAGRILWSTGVPGTVTDEVEAGDALATERRE